MRFYFLFVLAFAVPAFAAPRPEMVLQIGHNGAISDAAMSPSGQTIATVGEDGTVKLWNAGTGELRRTLAGGWNSEIVFSQDGRTLLSSGYPSLKVWDSLGGTLCHEWPIGRGFFSPDATRLAVPKYEERGARIEIWNATNGELLATLTASNLEYIHVAAWSKDGTIVASADYDGHLTLWNAADGKWLRTLDFRPHDLKSREEEEDRKFFNDGIAFSSDGVLIAAAGSDGAIRIAQTNSGRIVRKLGPLHGKNSFDQTFALLFARDGKTLLAAPQGKPVRIWNLATGKMDGHLNKTNSASSLSWAGDGSTLLLAGYQPALALWDAASNSLKKIFPNVAVGTPSARALSTSSDAQFLAVDLWQGNGALWDWKTLTRHALPPEGGTFISGASPLLVSLHDENVLEWRRVPSGQIWKKAKLKISPPKKTWRQSVKALAASPDGKTLAVFTDDTLYLAGARNGEIVAKLPGRKAAIYAVAFSPDGKWLTAGGEDEMGWSDDRGTVSLWNLAKPQAKPQILAAHNGVQSLAWNEDSRTLAVGCGNAEGEDSWGEIQLWDAPTAKLQRYLLGHKSPVTDLLWDGSTLLAASQLDLKTWVLPENLKESEQITAARTRETGAEHLTLLPNRKNFLISGGRGWEVRRFRDYSLVATLLPLPAVGANHAYLQSWILFTPDGFYTGSSDCERWIRWRLGNKLFPSAKFKTQFRRPPLVRAALRLFE